MKRTIRWASLGLVILSVGLATALTRAADGLTPQPGEVPVRITGGHDTAAVDRGRPVILIAAALNVPAEKFREAFTHVRPAHGRGPTDAEARQNKRELLDRLAKYGVTNERLDEVSNFYRYRPETGELWKHKEAVVFATVKDGKVTRFRVAEPGYGYSSMPTIAVDGVPGLRTTARLVYGQDLTANGAIRDVQVIGVTTQP